MVQSRRPRVQLKVRLILRVYKAGGAAGGQSGRPKIQVGLEKDSQEGVRHHVNSNEKEMSNSIL